MVKLRYNCLHVPQLCECEHHKKEFVFVEAKEVEFVAYVELCKFVVWVNNSMQRCWVYQVVNVEVE